MQKRNKLWQVSGFTFEGKKKIYHMTDKQLEGLIDFAFRVLRSDAKHTGGQAGIERKIALWDKELPDSGLDV